MQTKYKISDPNKYSAKAFSLEYLSVLEAGLIWSLKETIFIKANYLQKN